MRKLLSILGAIVVSSTGAASVVACSDSLYSNASDNHWAVKINHDYDEDILKASLLSRAKSLIIDNEFGVSDQKAKDYVLDKKINGLRDIVKTQKEADYLHGKTVRSQYSNFIDDNSIANIEKINTKGTIGSEGGIITEAKQGLMGQVYDKLLKLPDAVKGPIKSIINGALKIDDDSSDVTIAEAIKPMLQAISGVDVKTAMSGITYALTLLPKFSQYKILLMLVDQLKGTILDSLKDVIMPAIDKLIVATDLSDLGDKTLDQIPAEINGIFKDLLTGNYPDPKKDKDAKYTDALTASMRFISLSGMYLSMIPHDGSDAFDTLDKLGQKKLSDCEYFKIGQGKAFNLAPVLNEVSYYLSDADNDGRVQKLLQILFMKDETHLNEIGTTVATKYLAPLISQWIGEDDGSGIAMVNGDDLTAAFIKALTDAETFDGLYNDWETLDITLKDNGKEFKLSDVIKQNIAKGGDLYHAFFYNNYAPYDTDANGEVQNKASLKNLITLPLYKLLGLAKVKGFAFDDSYLMNTGLLPNYAGHYTQGSIVNLAKEITNTFGFTTSDVTGDDPVKAVQDQLKYHLFDFNKLKDFINGVLFDKNSFVKMFLKETQAYSDPAVVARELSLDLGYWNDNQVVNPKKIYIKQADADNARNPKEPSKATGDTLIAKLVKMLMPIMDKDINPDANDQSISVDDINGTIIKQSDNLKFLFSAVNDLVGNAIKETNYDYWFDKVFNENYVNANVIDGVEYSVFDYRDLDISKDKPWDPDLGFKVADRFNNGDIRDMSLTIRFNLGDIPQLINGVKIKGNDDIKMKKWIYTFEIRRDGASKPFQFVSANRIAGE